MNQTGWLIYNRYDKEQNEAYINWFIDEAKLQDITLKLVLREDITIGIIQNKKTLLHENRMFRLPDFAVVRTIEPFLNMLLESVGITVFNSYYISSICNNKALTHFHMNQLSIPMVNTIFIKKNNSIPIPLIPFPFVLKATGGRGGENVYLVNDDEEFEKHLADISETELIIQSTEKVQLGKDVRVFVVGNEIIGAVLRESKIDFRSNFKLGGAVYWYPLNIHETTLVKRIIDHFDFGMVGIDFLLDTNGRFLLNEIEDVVGSRTLSTISDINILKKYVTHIKKSGNP